MVAWSYRPAQHSLHSYSLYYYDSRQYTTANIVNAERTTQEAVLGHRRRKAEDAELQQPAQVGCQPGLHCSSRQGRFWTPNGPKHCRQLTQSLLKQRLACARTAQHEQGNTSSSNHHNQPVHDINILLLTA